MSTTPTTSAMSTPSPAEEPSITVGGRLRFAAASMTLRLLAVTGDPMARLLVGRPDDNPYPTYERLREQGRVSRSRTGVLAVTGHADCQQVLRDPRFGVRDAAGRPAGYDDLGTAAQGPLDGSFLELDPPDHTRLRRLAAPTFRPRLMRDAAEPIRDAAERLLHQALRSGRGEFDLMADYASPLPITVISTLLGVPEDERARFAQIGAIVGRSLDGVRSARQAQELYRSGRELADLFTRLAAERRVDPRDDVLTLLATAEAEEQITAEELVSLCGLLLIAGFETTVNLIGNGVSAMLEDRDRWRELVDDRARASAAVEETLRFDPPVQLTLRVAQEEVELAGTRLRAGALIAPILAAAGRDPSVYRDPGTFDLHRVDEPEHLAFSSGIHYCLGAPLARLEAEVAFAVLSDSLPGLRPAGPAVRRPGTTIRGFSSLPVRG